MFVSWSDLTADQQKALALMWQGSNFGIHRETEEQLRNLGLAESDVDGSIISEVGLSIVPYVGAGTPRHKS